MRRSNCTILCYCFVSVSLFGLTESFSQIPPPDLDKGPEHLASSSNTLSRRDSLLIGVGAAATYGYTKAIAEAFDRIDYPREHEEMVRSMLRTTLSAAIDEKAKSNTHEPIRLLEVGIGTAARLIRRGLYEFPAGTSIDLTGMDVSIPSDPKVLEDIKVPENVRFQTLQASITDSSTLPKKQFDAIVCCLTLCSVDDPEEAVSNIYRLLRPSGGVFGFVEHVAAPESTTLAWQQEVLDPLQQRLARNCHLHRPTGEIVSRVFGDAAKVLQYQEFQVDTMWPVSYQSIGVVQRIT